MTDEQDLEGRFAEAGLERLATPLLARAAPCVDLAPAEADVAPAVPIGASKFGGDPDVPPDFTWPRHGDRPLSFLTQIDLADVPRDALDAPFPPAGLLSFFYDERSWGFSPADRGAARVFLFDPMAELSRTAGDGVVSRPERAWSLRTGTSLPNLDDVQEELGLADAELEACEVVEESFAPLHRLFGNPLAVQEDAMEIECQLVTAGLECGDESGYEDPRAEALVEEAGRWRLLLQLDSDEALGMAWGDLGRVYFWIPEESLARGAVEDAWLILQCG